MVQPDVFRLFMISFFYKMLLHNFSPKIVYFVYCKTHKKTNNEFESKRGRNQTTNKKYFY